MDEGHAKLFVDSPWTRSASDGVSRGAALQRAIDDRRALNREITEAKARLAALEKRAAGLAKLIVQLSGPTDQGHVPHEELEPARGSTLYNNVVSLLKTIGTKTCSAPDVMKALQQRGVPFYPSQIHNTLAYLAREGKLIRLERGRYLVVPYGVMVETTDDLLNDGGI